MKATVDSRRAMRFVNSELEALNRLHAARKVASSKVGIDDVTPRNCETSPSAGEHVDVFYEEMKPLWIIFRCIGLFPLQKPSTGVTRFRWVSKEFASTFVYYVLASGLVGFEVVRQLTDAAQLSDGVNDVLLVFSRCLYLMPQFVLPVCNWFAAPHLADLMNKWVAFQVKFCQVTRHPIRLNLSRKTLILAVLVVFTSYGHVYTQYLLLTNKIELWECLLFGFTMSLTNLHLLLWHLMCGVSSRTSTRMMDLFEQDFTRTLGSDGRLVSDYRILWLQLSRLTQTFGNVFAHQFEHIVVLYFILNLTVVFSALVFIDFQEELFYSINIMFVFVFLTSSQLIFTISAHNATNQVGKVVSDRLQDLTSGDSETRNQLQRFEATVFNNPPLISLNGYVQVNRHMMVSIFSSTMTYLMVLLQFKLGEQSNLTQKSNSTNSDRKE